MCDLRPSRCKIAPIESIAFNLDIGYSRTIKETERRKLNMTTTTFDSVGDLKSRLQLIFSAYTPTEIAEGTGIPLGTVKNYKYKRSDLSQMPLATVEEVFRWQSENEPLKKYTLIKMTKEQVEALYGKLDYDKEIITGKGIFLQRLIDSKKEPVFEERTIIVNPNADGNYLTGNMGSFGTLTHVKWYDEVVRKVLPKLSRDNYFYSLLDTPYGYPKDVSSVTYDGQDFVQKLPSGLLHGPVHNSNLNLNVIEVIEDSSKLSEEERDQLNSITFDTRMLQKVEFEDIHYSPDSLFSGKYELFKSIAKYVTQKENGFWSGVLTGDFVKLFAIPVFMDVFISGDYERDLLEFMSVYTKEVLLSEDRGDLGGFGDGDYRNLKAVLNHEVCMNAIRGQLAEFQRLCKAVMN